MKVSANVERALTVVLILALSKNQERLSSRTLSTLIESSDSSIKKLLTALSKASIIDSFEGKDGGYQLARPLEKLNLADVWLAVENPIFQVKSLNLVDRLFKEKEQIERSKISLQEGLDRAAEAYVKELKTIGLRELLLEDYQEKRFSWLERLKEKNNGKNEDSCHAYR